MDNSPPRLCPACESNSARHQGNLQEFEIFVCRSCRSIYTDHLPTAAEALDYDEYYSESNLSVPTFIVDRTREIVGGFSSFRRSNRLLDIGFGAGTILDAAREQQWEPFGLEISMPAVEQARQKGFDVFYGNLMDAGYPDQFFDVITASEILEHLPNTEEYLIEIRRLLRPGGLLWATTPSATGLSFRLLGTHWSVLCPPDHTQLFSVKGVTLMLKKAGFSSVRIDTFGVNPLEILHYFKPSKSEDTKFDRVKTGYEINESMMRNPMRKNLKNLLNQTLNLTRLGDSLKIFARR